MFCTMFLFGIQGHKIFVCLLIFKIKENVQNCVLCICVTLITMDIKGIYAHITPGRLGMYHPHFIEWGNEMD